MHPALVESSATMESIMEIFHLGSFIFPVSNSASLDHFLHSQHISNCKGRAPSSKDNEPNRGQATPLGRPISPWENLTIFRDELDRWEAQPQQTWEDDKGSQAPPRPEAILCINPRTSGKGKDVRHESSGLEPVYGSCWLSRSQPLPTPFSKGLFSRPKRRKIERSFHLQRRAPDSRRVSQNVWKSKIR